MPIPHAPVHASTALPITRLRSIRGAPELLWMPAPLHPAFRVMVLPRMVGDELPIWIPPPLDALNPPVIVNPFNTDSRPSRDRKVTTVPPRCPSMVVTSGPCS